MLLASFAGTRLVLLVKIEQSIMYVVDYLLQQANLQTGDSSSATDSGKIGKRPPRRGGKMDPFGFERVGFWFASV